MDIVREYGIHGPKEYVWHRTPGLVIPMGRYYYNTKASKLQGMILRIP